MRVGRTLPPAAAPIGWRNLITGVTAISKEETELSRFSRELKQYYDKPHCFLVSSGKAALTLILGALKEQYPHRDEVIIPAYTCYSVPSAIVRAGLKITLCDTSADNFDFDFDQLKPLLKSKRLLCVVPTHLFGMPADVLRLKGMIDDPEVTIVEDAAQAMGGEWQGLKLGTSGDVCFFSLGRGKAFSTVEGGIILTDNDELATNLNQKHSNLSGYKLFDILKLFMYAIALNIFQRPSLFWLPKALPFLRLGETVFDPCFKISRMSAFQAGLAKNWGENLSSFRMLRQRNVKTCIAILDSNVFKQFINEKGGIPDLIRFPVEIMDEKIRLDFLDNANIRRLGITTAYPTAVSDIPELADMFKTKVYHIASKHSKQLVTFPVHPLLNTNDLKSLDMILKLITEPKRV